MFRGLSAGLVATFTLLGPAMAAEFTWGGDTRMGCLLTMSGRIETGDTDRFLAFAATLPDPDRAATIGPASDGQARHLCLSGSGGDMLETARLIQTLLADDATLDASGHPFWLRDLATAVTPDATCAGACAMLFFAGQMSEGDHGRWPDRMLHASARLGLASEAEPVADGSYDRADMETARQLGTAMVTGYLRLAAEMEIPLHLIGTAFERSTDVPAWLDQPMQLAEAGVSVTGIPPLARIGKRNIEALCGGLAGEVPPADHNPRSLLWADHAYFETFEHRDDDSLVFSILPDDEGDYACAGEIFADGTGYIAPDDTNYTDVWPWMLYPGALSLPELYARTRGVERTPADLMLAQDMHERATECFAVENGAISGRAACQLSSERVVLADGRQRLHQLLSWSDGSVTVTIEDGTALMNGEPVALKDDTPEALSGWGDICLDYGRGVFCYRAE